MYRLEIKFSRVLFHFNEFITKLQTLPICIFLLNFGILNVDTAIYFARYRLKLVLFYTDLVVSCQCQTQSHNRCLLLTNYIQFKF